MSKRRGSKMRAAAAAKQEIPPHSPRHPRFQAELDRITNVIDRAGRVKERDDRVRQGRAFARPASSERYIAVNPSDPDSVRRFELAPSADHPLAEARQTKKISHEQYVVGNRYRLTFESAFETAWGRDITQAMMVDGGKPNYESAVEISLGNASSQADLHAIHTRLGTESALIIMKVCGLGWRVGDAVRHSTPKVHPNGVWSRFEEALDALVRVLQPRDVVRAA